MDYRPTSNKRPAASRRAFTVPEMLVGLGVGALVVAAIVTLASNGAANMARMLNYAEMDAEGQTTTDQLSRDIRRANRVLNYTTNSLVLEDFDGATLTYTYNPAARTLTRVKGAENEALMRGCDAFTFTLGKRNPTGAFESFPAAMVADCKVINVAWKSSRTIRGQKMTTENLTSAQVVIRRQGP